MNSYDFQIMLESLILAAMIFFQLFSHNINIVFDGRKQKQKMTLIYDSVRIL